MSHPVLTRNPHLAKKLADRLPTAFDLDIKDPETGELETTIKIVGNEDKLFIQRVMDRVRAGNKVELNDNQADNFDLNVWYAAAHIVSWDEEYFGVPFTVENAVDVFMNPAAAFILSQINEKTGEKERFFPKASVEPVTA